MTRRGERQGHRAWVPDASALQRPPDLRARRFLPSGFLGLLALVAHAAIPALAAQPPSSLSLAETGNFYIQSFAPEDYKAHAQNWGFAQGPDGRIYVANGAGVLEYDGVAWRLIRVANRSMVRSLTVDAEGRVYVGASGDLGYLEPDRDGGLVFVSLLEHIPEDDRGFKAVWRAFALPDGVYFHTYRRIFRWRDGQMRVWRPEKGVFFNMFGVLDTLYVQVGKQGLHRMEGDALRLAPGNALFPTQSIYSLVPLGTDAYLVVTRADGLFRCPTDHRTGEMCAPFGSDLRDLLSQMAPYRGSDLGDGLLAIGTSRAGVVLLDQNGRLLRTLDETSGLRNEVVWSTFVDRDGGLWLGLNDGLARVEVSTPISTFDKTNGLQQAVSAVARHDGTVYAATNHGIYELRAEAGTRKRFEPYLEGKGQCWSLLSTAEGLLAGCNGVYGTTEERLSWTKPESHIYAMLRSRRDPSLIYVGFAGGLARLRLRDGQWLDEGRMPGISQQVRSLIEDAEGRLWLGTANTGVLRLDPAGGPEEAMAIRHFQAEHGLPTGWIDVLTIAGRVVLRTDDGLYRLEDPDGEAVRFVRDTTFDALLPTGSVGIYRLTEDDRGRVWIVTAPASGVALPQPDGGYAWQGTVLSRASPQSIYTIVAEPGGPLWIGGPRGLVRMDTDRPGVPSSGYSVQIRRITSDGVLLHGGEGPGAEAEPAWPHRSNALRFAFAAPRYDAPDRTQYRTRLDGFDEDWSDWSAETDKDYTNLWEKRYIFRVEARDVYGVISRQDAFAFRILPPWYRTWWAYGLYGLALTAVVLAYVRSHRQELRRERQVAARERAANRRLREVDRLKDEFLARTSHELRTPLYGITGLAESLIDGAAGDVSETMRANLSMIVASGRRLGHLVNDILDFSKLRHRSLELDRRPVELHALVDVVLALVEPLAGAQELRLENGVPLDLPKVHADENRLQQILYNLIGNAIKFTEAGIVEVSAAVQGEHVAIRVTDTGIGIAEEEQARIFDAFEQADASIEREYGGTGLGLAVSRQLVELHGGSIQVKSSPGQGSTFSFTLPVADEAAEVGTRPAIAVPSPGPLEEPVLAVAPSGVAPDTDPQAAAPPIHILAVDDEPVNRQVIQNYLAGEPFSLSMAASGDEALALIREHRFDLVLLDVMMPRVSGFEVCRALREMHPMEEMPVLFLTAKNQTSDVVAGLSLGANDYLTKPIARDELLARLRPHLALLQIHHQLEDLVEEKISHIKVLEGLLPICSSCKKIRDEKEHWTRLESYIHEHSEAKFTHGLCPECAAAILGEFGQA